MCRAELLPDIESFLLYKISLFPLAFSEQRKRRRCYKQLSVKWNFGEIKTNLINFFFSSSLHANSKSFQQKTAIRYSQQGLQLWGWPPSKTASTSPTAYHLVRGPEYSEDLRGQPFWPFVCRCYYATSWDGYSIAFVCHIMQSLEMKLSTPSLVFSLSSSKKTFLTKNWKEKSCVCFHR